MTTQPPPDVARVIGALPRAQADQLRHLRHLVFDVAKAEEVGPLTETLKWGEPAYLTEATRSGSTLRLGPVRGTADTVALFVNCRTSLADSFRERFGPALRVDGDRAVVIGPQDTPDEDVLRTCIALTLTYHRWRRR